MGKLLLVINMLIMNNLKYCREELEMTQEELGNVLGVSRKTVTGWENNHDTMPLPKLIRFCNLYKFSANYVTGLSKTNNYIELEKANKTKIGNRLKTIRTKLNITQQDIADECMISQATYSGYENGKFLITTMTLFTICYNHKISMDEILKK